MQVIYGLKSLHGKFHIIYPPDDKVENHVLEHIRVGCWVSVRQAFIR